MAQIFYRANLGDADFPLVSEFQGRTIIQGSIDQHYMPSPSLGSGEKDKGIPEAYYMHNVLPTLQGYKSCAYDTIVASIPATSDMTEIFPIKDFAGNRGHIGITASGKTYIITQSHTNWYEITPVGQPAGIDVTVASATGTSFICYSNWGIYTIDLVARSLSPASITWDSPLTNASMKGIATSNNYLLAHDGATLYWSSSLSVLDFKASQITGAGNGVPTAATGAIIAIAAVGIGFAIYCQGNIVVATFSGNVQFPWIFKEAPNGSGIESTKALSRSGDDASNYAWATAGLLKVTLGGCSPVFPEVSDFLGGRIFEDFDTTTDIFTTQYLTSVMAIRVAFLSSRFLIISYGVTSLTHALVYDASLKRWGKLKVAHVQAFDITFKTTAINNYSTYTDLGSTVYKDYFAISYLNMVPPTPNAIAPDAKHAVSFLQADGTLLRLNIEYGDITADAAILLGKYQVARNNFISMQSFTLETIDSFDNNFTVQVLTSYDGKTTGLTSAPIETIHPEIREYKKMVTGSNHSLLIKGAFHLTAAVLVFSKHGNR